MENLHSNGVLHSSRAPAPRLSPALVEEARRLSTRVLEALDYVGVAALELFELDGHLVVNELAPRVHNSGHWTLEGSDTSQFENHLRAVLGLPLGSTSCRGHSVMLNVLGQPPALEGLLRHRGLRLHLYGKEPRPGRKVGHLTVTTGAARDAARVAREVARTLGARVSRGQRRGEAR